MHNCGGGDFWYLWQFYRIQSITNTQTLTVLPDAILYSPVCYIPSNWPLLVPQGSLLNSWRTLARSCNHTHTRLWKQKCKWASFCREQYQYYNVWISQNTTIFKYGTWSSLYYQLHVLASILAIIRFTLRLNLSRDYTICMVCSGGGGGERDLFFTNSG